jgi:hypothetical protein
MSRPMFIPLRRTSGAMSLNLNARTLRRQLWVGLAVAVIAASALHNLVRSEGGSLKKTAPIDHEIVLPRLPVDATALKQPA